MSPISEISREELDLIKDSGHWPIQKISRHEEGPEAGEYSFLCVWKTTAWDVTDQKTNAFLNKQVCPLPLSIVMH